MASLVRLFNSMEPESTAQNQTPPLSAKEHLKTTRQKPAAGYSILQRTQLQFRSCGVGRSGFPRTHFAEGRRSKATLSPRIDVVLTLLSPETPVCDVKLTFTKATQDRCDESTIPRFLFHLLVHLSTCVPLLVTFDHADNILGTLVRYPEWPSISCITSSPNQILLPEHTLELIAINLIVRHTARCESWGNFVQSQSKRNWRDSTWLTYPSQCNRHDSVGFSGLTIPALDSEASS